MTMKKKSNAKSNISETTGGAAAVAVAVAVETPGGAAALKAGDGTSLRRKRGKTTRTAAASAKGAAAPKGSSRRRKASSASQDVRQEDGKTEGQKKRGERNRELGARGEEAAVRFLKRHDYEIIERNWTCPAGEADIIAMDEDAIVFVEVKTRRSTDMGLPSEAVDAKKRERYERIAAMFLAHYDVVDVQVRFDIISIVVVSPDRAMIRHHINAFGVA